MASQIPAGAEGTVAGVMIYCSICLIASSLMIWLTWTHHERTSYIAMLSYFATISIAGSLIQQTYEITRYEELVKEVFENRKRNPGSPEVAIANGSVGPSLVLYYIQYYCYSVEAMCVMFWAGSLAQSAAARRRFDKLLRRIDKGGKAFTVLFPLCTILLLRIPQVQANFVLFILLADLPLMLSLFFGCSLMIVIFARYVNSKRRFLHWTPDGGYTGNTSSALESGTHNTTTTSTGGGGGPAKPRSGGGGHGMWDRWLMVRFTIAFVALSIFEVTNTLFQLNAVNTAEADLAAIEPNLTAERARATWIFFMPGVTAGLFIFIIFGTTAPLRKHMWETFVPARLRGGGRRRQQEQQMELDAGRGGAKAAAGRRAGGDGGNVGPTPPPKDFGGGGGGARAGYRGHETEMDVYPARPARAAWAQGGGPRVGDDGRSDSDEWPMLPIMRNDKP